MPCSFMLSISNVIKSFLEDKISGKIRCFNFFRGTPTVINKAIMPLASDQTHRKKLFAPKNDYRA